MATMSDERDATSDDEATSQIWARHVFVCTSGKYCPEVDGDGLGVHARLKERIAAEGLNKTVRINHSGCLDQCGHGPMIVVYPESVWYWGVQVEDVDEIVREHLRDGRPVERLRYRNYPARTSFLATKRTAPLAGPSALPSERSAAGAALIAHRFCAGW